MPRGPRSQSTPPSSTSSSTFGRGKTSTLESLRSASANSSPILPSTSGNQHLECVDEEGSDGDDGHPPTSSSPSGTTTQSSTLLGGSSHADPNLSSGTSAEHDSLHPTKVSGPPPNMSTKDSAVASPSNTLANPLYAMLRSGANPDEPSVPSPGNTSHSPCPPVAAASSSPAGSGDTAAPRPPEPPARGLSPPRRADSRLRSSARGRSPHRRPQRDRHGQGRSDSHSPGDAPPSNHQWMHSRSVSSRRGSHNRHHSHPRSDHASHSRTGTGHPPVDTGLSTPCLLHPGMPLLSSHQPSLGLIILVVPPPARNATVAPAPAVTMLILTAADSILAQPHCASVVLILAQPHHASVVLILAQPHHASVVPILVREAESRRHSSSCRSRSHHRGVVLPDPKYQRSSIPIAAAVDVLPEVAAALRNGWGGHIAMGWFNPALALHVKWRSDGSEHRSVKNLCSFDLNRISSEDFTEIAKAMPLAVEAYLIPAKECAPGSGQALRMADSIRQTFEMVISQRNFRDQFPTWREYTQDVLYEWYLHPRQCGSPYVLDPSRYCILWEWSFRAPALAASSSGPSSLSSSNSMPSVSQPSRSRSSRPQTQGYHSLAPSVVDDGCFLYAESSHTTRGHVLKPFTCSVPTALAARSLYSPGDIKLWHRRFAHSGMKRISNASNLVEGLEITAQSHDTCEDCILGNH
ncbi:hypothetical protein C8R42DRAFT_725788 [Lentinula raphanica]|nr:hypothetical protein C8R42DRAFT_725788 [Lentinula raphanica]